MAPFCRCRGALLAAPLLLSLLLGSCSLRPGPSEEQRRAAVASAFVERVVLPGYEQLAANAADLATSLDQLAAQPDPARLQRARAAWADARRSWETAESWAFGPAQTQGFDSNLDDWPVNGKDLKTALAAGGLSAQQFARLTSTARGFHGIEAVLFGQAAPPPTAASLTAAELNYLRLAGQDLVRQARGLLQAWRGPSGFGQRFAAGDQADGAIAEILQGMVGTLQEVSAEKLGHPLATRRASDLESFYSGSTRADVLANLAGIQEGLQRSGLLELIGSRDGEAGRTLAKQLTLAQQRLQALPARLDRSLNDDDARRRIAAAIAAVDRCATTLERLSEGWS